MSIGDRELAGLVGLATFYDIIAPINFSGKNHFFALRFHGSTKYVALLQQVSNIVIDVFVILQKDHSLREIPNI